MTDPSFNIKLDPNKGVPFDAKKTPLKRSGEKDFRKIFEQDDDQKKQAFYEQEKVEGQKGKNTYEETAALLEASEHKSKKTGVSLFALAEPVKEIEEDLVVPITQENLSLEEELPVAEFSEEVREESLSALFQGYGSKEKLRLLQMEANRLSSSPSEVVEKQPLVFKDIPQENKKIEGSFLQESQQTTSPKKTPLSKGPLQEELPFAPSSNLYSQKTKNTFSSQFVQEQPDLSAINPLTTALPSTVHRVESKAVQHSGMTAQEIQELVDQIISKLYTVRTEGKTDTLITLNRPPLFEGTHLVITSYNTAKGELNLSFENLNLAAKRIMDRQENQDSLRWALEQKGLTVHILTVTTLSETSSQIVGGGAPQRGKEEGFKEKRQNQEQDTEENRG